MTTLTTARLVLRPFIEADVPEGMRFRNAPEVTRWLINTTVTGQELEESIRDRDDAVDHTKAVLLEGRLIGTVFLEIEDGLGQPGKPTGTEAHLGYLFDPAYGGQGYASEAAQTVLDHAFADLGVRRLTAGCFADNLASVRILEKLGMRREQHGIQDSWHADLGWIDGYTYGLLRSEWQQRASHPTPPG